MVNEIEYFFIGGFNPKDYIQQNRWLHPYLINEILSQGANQIRVNGRLAVHINDQRIKNILKKEIDHIFNIENIKRTEIIDQKVRLNNGISQIFIITSICGGTGSGMLLDISCLLKHLLTRGKKNAILIRPEVFYGCIKNDTSLKANALATLYEIAEMMDSGKYDVTFPHIGHFSFDKEPLFDNKYLVDKENEYFGLNNYDAVTSMITRAIFYQVATSIGRCHEEIFYNYSDIISNSIETKGIRNPSHKTCFSGFGISELYYDAEETIEDCLNILLEKIIEQIKIRISEHFDISKVENTIEILRKMIDSIIDGLILKDINYKISKQFFSPHFNHSDRERILLKKYEKIKQSKISIRNILNSNSKEQQHELISQINSALNQLFITYRVPTDVILEEIDKLKKKLTLIKTELYTIIENFNPEYEESQKIQARTKFYRFENAKIDQLDRGTYEFHQDLNSLLQNELTKEAAKFRIDTIQNIIEYLEERKIIFKNFSSRLDELREIIKQISIRDNTTFVDNAKDKNIASRIN